MITQETAQPLIYPQGQQTNVEGEDVFHCIKIGVASPQRILGWSRGEVTKPETINYRTLKPEMGGLFCERIFGPSKDWECFCGKYKRVRHRGIICERCGVEVTESKVRRHRMGHIKLAAPVVHIWYLKGIPSYLSLLLGISLRHLEDVAYYNAYIVLKDQTLDRDSELEAQDLEEEETDEEKAKHQVIHLKQGQLLSEDQFEQLCDVYGEDSFEAEMGAPALKRLLGELDLKKEADMIWKELKENKPSGQKKIKFVKRLRVIENFLSSGAQPTWMVLEAVPVIPPDLRPMVQLDGGRFATSDLNDLYRRVINRNNRLNRLLEMEAPDIIIRNEKRMLQEAVDALFDNGRRGRTVVGPNNRPLKSLSDIVEGKQGRFRQNLLGKRVDYSGRSVIVVGPPLELHQCGLPKEMALELFKPFVMNKLVEQGVVQNIKSAKKMIERQEDMVWDILEGVIKGHPVLLNRAPTLHRLGIQAFEPVLVEGRAIQLHPLVCTAFNADFDGDQMAVHVPLSIEAQTEARLLMMATNNILLPATGQPIIKPSQDMVIGCYYITTDNPYAEMDDSPLKGNGKVFSSPEELISAYQTKEVDVHAKVLVRMPVLRLPDHEMVMANLNNAVRLNKNGEPVRDESGSPKVDFKGKPLAQLRTELAAEGKAMPSKVYILTTAGRVDINRYFPEDIKFKNQVFGGPQLSALIAESYLMYGNERTSLLANDLKNAGFAFATRAGVSITISDLEVPEVKKDILADAEATITEAEFLFQRGKITETERYTRVINTWHEASEKLTDVIKKDYNRLNNIYMMAFSGARGNISQVRQLIGMRGLMADPSGKIIDLPIKANFKEGLNVTEYVLSSYGARKGIVDTALRTADSGYLTRRLADVAQDVIILDEDCGTENFFRQKTIREGDTVWLHLSDRLVGRVAAYDIKDGDGNVLVKRNEVISPEIRNAIMASIDHIPESEQYVDVRSPMGCESNFGVCRNCYGWSLTNQRLVDRGEPIGIISAQSIGEPGTQLTMRTFHTGGVFEGSAAEKIYPKLKKKDKFTANVSFDDKKLQTQLIRTQAGENLNVLEIEVEIEVQSGRSKDKVVVPPGFTLKVNDGDEVTENTILAVAVRESGKFGRGSIERKTKEVIAGMSGQVVLDKVQTEKRKQRNKQQDETIVTSKDGILWVYSGNVVNLPTKCEVRVEDQQSLVEGDTLASIATSTEYGGRVSLITNEEGDQTLSIVTAELSLLGASIPKDDNDLLQFEDESLPVNDFELLISNGSRLENNQIIARAKDSRTSVDVNGVIHYMVDLNEKDPVAKDTEVLVLPEESYSIKDKVVLFEDPASVVAGTEIIQGITVEQPGFVNTEFLDTSSEILFYPGAKAYRFLDEAEEDNFTVKEESIVKKGAVIGSRWNPETEETEEIKSEIDGLVQMTMPEIGETLVIIRPFKKFKVKPLPKFFEVDAASDAIGLDVVTRLLHRKGDRVKAGNSLARIELQFKLDPSLISLGGRVALRDSEENEERMTLNFTSTENLSSQKASMRGAALLDSPDISMYIDPLVEDGQVVEAKHHVASTEYRVNSPGVVTVFKDEHSGILRMMILTDEHERVYDISGKVNYSEGDKVFEGDEIADGVVAVETGVITKITKKQVVMRKARPYLVGQGSHLTVEDANMVRQGEVIAILTYEQMKTGDIIQGLPRVEELLETRKPKESATLCEYTGTVKDVVRDDDKTTVVISGVTPTDTNEKEYTVDLPYTASCIVVGGQKIERGEPLTSGAINPHELLKIQNVAAAQRYLVDSVQKVYRSQGVKINDKHIEVIVRQMTRKVKIDNPGETIFLPGEIINETRILTEKRRMESEGLDVGVIEYTPILLGITKASLNTESFLSAASFQETTRVLTEAAVQGKRDWLRGLKENVIIGRLIPAGTGMRSQESRDKLKEIQKSVRIMNETKAAEAAAAAEAEAAGS